MPLALPDDKAYFALAIRKVSDAGRHSGMLYLSSDDDYKLLHLGQNFGLLNDAPGPEFYWTGCRLPETDRKFLAVICERIATAKPDVPYGFDSAGFEIDRTTGMIKPGPLGKGYTCASFVLEVMKLAYIHLLKEDEWPENVEDDWQKYIVWVMANFWQAAPEQVAALEQDVGCRRFTPSQVVGSSTLVSPVGYEDAVAISAALEMELLAAA